MRPRRALGDSERSPPQGARSREQQDTSRLRARASACARDA